jgi:hypothetical protein
VTTNNATLRGKVDPHGCPTTYRFDYGTTTAYGSVTPDLPAGSGTKSIMAAAAISGLPPHTRFHFRIVATSAAGATEGTDLPFKTRFACAPGGARPPAVVTEPPAVVTATGATLGGKVNAHGCPTTYRFEYGTTTAYGNVTPGLPAGSGTRSIIAATSISKLPPHTVFHFRIVATSAAGITAGGDLSFTTGFAPPSVRIIGHRAIVKRGFVVVIHLRCSSASVPCQGRLLGFRKHRMIGQRSFLLPANRRGVVSLRLNRRGRNLLRHQGRPRVMVVVRGTPSGPPTSMLLIRRFRLR